MIIVDDHLALRALAGGDDTYWIGETPSVPWVLYYRLLRALRDPASSGRLSRSVTQQMTDYASDPPSDVLHVIDPRPHTSVATELQARYRLSMAAADLLGASIHFSTAIHVIEDNIGRNWTEACDIEGVELRVIPR